jgi:glyoxylase-like metal-dependent hydrolase (beta-lactamase superfamily II)
VSEQPQRPYFAMPYPGIFRVTCATPMMGLPHVHVYMARGPEGGLVLFDTAMPYDDSFDRIRHGVEYLGYTMTDIERIYLTHAHPDHFGCSGMLQQASGAPVVCHTLAKRTLEAMGNPDPERWMKRMNIYAEFGWESPEMMNMPESRTMQSAFSSMGLATDLVAIEEGDVVTFAGGEWDIHWTPGHEEGHVVFHNAREGVTIVGDTVLGKITPHVGWMLEPEDPLGQFLDSLEKVAKLNSSLLLPGHGRPMDEGAERARSIAAHHGQRLRRCMEIVVRGGPMTAIDIARALFDRELMAFEERLALAETLSHTEYLRLRGRLQREMVDGVWKYDAPRSLVP